MTTPDRETWLRYAALYRRVGIEPAAEACEKMAAEVGEVLFDGEAFYRQYRHGGEPHGVWRLYAGDTPEAALPGGSYETVRVVITRKAEES